MKRRLYRALLRLYPAAFREEYGDEMERAFAEQRAPWGEAVRDVLTVAPREHAHVIWQDLRYAFRSIAARPGFAAVAVASLALGIGANTAIFSLWYSVTRAPLPLVKQPEQLVMLTNPEAIGQMSGDPDGERNWLSYPEFELMRDHLEGLSGVMASGSQMERWRVRIQGGEREPVDGHYVTGGYFSVLRVAPLLGRVFTPEDDLRDSPEVVISHGYWMRRFGGRADVLGHTIDFGKIPVTVIGVMPEGFTGEVAMQQPDLWIPARMQPHITADVNLLVDGPAGGNGIPEKQMWLHVFGRLKPGATLAQIQSRADALFAAELAQFYRKATEQRLVVHEASRGVSDLRAGISGTLTAMLGGAAILVLIACVNLANLLLARGAARRSEFAIRLAQGASRGRLIRQLVTESVVLTSIGAGAGLTLAYALYGALVVRFVNVGWDTGLRFNLNLVTLAFAAGATFLAVLLSGCMPAWGVTNVDAQESLREEARGSTASAGKARFGRALVAVQLALALPLLAVAGLLVWTVQNTMNVDLGYPPQGLIQAFVISRDAGYDSERDAAVRKRLRDQLQRIPGVMSVSYSENGLFTGRSSGHRMRVEGYENPDPEASRSLSDLVAPNYFETLGVRAAKGRTFLASDGKDAPSVMVVDEAYVQKFFSGRDPLGKRVFMGRGRNERAFQIVGVVPNLATQNAYVTRSPLPHDYIPEEQRAAAPIDLTYVLRISTDPAPVFAAINQIVDREDPLLYTVLQTMDEAMAPLTAEARTVGTLAVAFGSIAMLLSAIGLYGVLAYGVTRRRGEIGIRIALGAARQRVVWMILRESAIVVIGGLVLGLGPAYAVSKTIRAQYAEFAPPHPTVLAVAALILLVVAFAAAYLPARRASRLDPMTALRQE